MSFSFSFINISNLYGWGDGAIGHVGYHSHPVVSTQDKVRFKKREFCREVRIKAMYLVGGNDNCSHSTMHHQMKMCKLCHLIKDPPSS